MTGTKIFSKHYLEYEEWFENNEFVYLSELSAIKHFVPKDKKGIEVGVGSGRFAKPLNIKIGVDPSENMAKLARKRGIEVVQGVCEDLPFKESSFSFVLLVTTICFLDDVDKCFHEIRRVLKNEGEVIIGFIDKQSPLGKIYQVIKDENIFYKNAIFYSVEEVLEILSRNGFREFEIVQTLFGELESISKIQDFKSGYGSGGFVVIKAKKA